MTQNQVIRFLPKGLFIPLFLLFVVFSACKTTKDSQPQQTDQSKAELSHALLWRIEGKELQEPSYLYGTIHLIKSESFFFPKGTLNAFESSKDVFFEIDMNEMSDMSAMMGMLDKLHMPDGVSLKTLLSEEDYTMVSAHFKKMGLPMFMFERMKPMFLTAFASEDMDFGNLMNPSNSEGDAKSYEFEFLELAKTLNKPVAGLETIEFQLSVFDKIPYSAQANMLVESIKMSDEGEDQLDHLTEVYVTQDINAMVNMMDDDSMGLGVYEDILLKDRNENWIPIMESQMQKNATFFAVGAGHLGGEYGVIRLLMKAGYKMTPVSHSKSIN